MHNILLVGGTFDYAGGKPSGVVRRMAPALQKHAENVDVYNGGFADELSHNILLSVTNYDIVIWMPNVPNDIPKMRDVKAINPKTILISSKRNDNEKYSFAELINRALALKSNLTIEFAKQLNGTFKMRVFDPLGTVYYEGDDIEAMVAATYERAARLVKFTRVPSVPAEGSAPTVPNEERFFKFARECSEIFHNLIQPDKGVTRFLGNMSFRCQNGFPSFRGNNGIIYVSRRNVDKRDINATSFVPTYLDEAGAVRYFGEHKPSVDTPIQQRLYKMFPQINYMIHAHCYINHPDALCTFHPVPCGAIEEVAEIFHVIKYARHLNPDFIAINLLGHGCILMATDVAYFEALVANGAEKGFTSRQMPENIVQTFVNTVPGELMPCEPSIQYRCDMLIDNDLYEKWLGGVFTKVVCEAKNRNALDKAIRIANELGLKENKDYFLIKDCCLTELTPEEYDEYGVGRTLTCIGFRPLPIDFANRISKKFQLLK